MVSVNSLYLIFYHSFLTYKFCIHPCLDSSILLKFCISDSPKKSTHSLIPIPNISLPFPSSPRILLISIWWVILNNNKHVSPRHLEQSLRRRALLRRLHGNLHLVPLSLFSYNPSIAICWKGCDYATGRVSSDKGRVEAQRMCKRFTTESMSVEQGEL